MCDCWQCNMTEEEQTEEAEIYIEWEYGNYCKTTDNPLPIEDWLKQFESPNPKENKKWIQEQEKEYLLVLLEWQLADHEGQKDWGKYHICKKLIEKIKF